MKFPGFIGGSYESQALTADCSRTVNWFPEVLQDKNATAPATLLPTPGVERLDTEVAYKVQPGRAHTFINGREFAVLGQHLLEFDETAGLIPSGAVRCDFGSASGDPATISSNGDGGDQLFITVNGDGWVYNLTANTATQIAALVGKATMGAYLDGYFLCLDSNTSMLYVSALLDGATWTPGTDFAQRSLAPDKWVSMAVVGRNVWLFGTQTSEVWYDSGGTFPLTPHPSGLINLGCAAAWSPKVVGSDVVWLATSKAGHVCVARASGFSPSIISTYPMETAFQEYQSIGNAVADSYSSDGHTFYLLHFPEAGYSWGWDATTTLWHERGTWIPALNRYTAWRPRFYAHAFGEHRILDAGGPGLYRMATTLPRDVGGQRIRRLRRAPAIMQENKTVFYTSFEVDLEPGLGLPFRLETPRQPIEWTNETDVTIVGGTITKTTLTNAYDAGAFSRQPIEGSGYVEFSSPNVAAVKAFGLVTDSRFNVLNDDDFEYGIWIRADGKIQTVEAGVNTNTNESSGAGDEFRIQVSGTEVSFYWNGNLLSTAAAPATFPMYAKGSIYTASAVLADAFIASTVAVENPQVMLRLSNDGGRTWISEEMRGSGKIGEYLTRVRWNRLGSAPRRVFEVAVTDDTPFRLTGAYLETRK